MDWYSSIAVIFFVVQPAIVDVQDALCNICFALTKNTFGLAAERMGGLLWGNHLEVLVK